MEPTHASFFSGVGGLDLGLERAGWRTVSFSEIDPYASAVLAERWPGVPNLGDIVQVAAGSGGAWDGDRGGSRFGPLGGSGSRDPWRDASLWSGGFPCQDLSVAGKRRGMGEGTRSGLAFAFLDLVERHRPPAVLLENVPGLLSSHRGRDMAALLGRLVELGYGVAYRVLDARHFGVPQRRRRVFIVGLRSDPDDPDGRLAAERAAAVLSVGARCRRHPPTGVEAGEEPAAGAPCSPDGIVGQAVRAKWSKQAGGPAGDEHHNLICEYCGEPPDTHLRVGPSPDPRGVRAPDGLAGRLDDRLMGSLREHVRPGSDDNEAQAGHLVATLRVGGRAQGAGSSYDNTPVVAFVKHRRAGEDDPSPESWGTGELAPTVDSVGHGPRTATAVTGGSGVNDDPLLPLGLDSHRYRCCGNGVVAPVAEWIGRQLLAAIERAA